MRLKLINFIIFVVGLVSNPVMAKEIKVVLKLSSVQAEKTEEKKGDDVYFSITEYSSLGHSKEDRVPVSPAHWLSKQLSGVKNIPLWEASLKENEEVKLIISLNEQDFPPWDVDDLLGSAQLSLKNHAGKLEKEWSIPVFEETKEVEIQHPFSNPQAYLFKGAGAQYRVAFFVEEK